MHYYIYFYRKYIKIVRIILKAFLIVIIMFLSIQNVPVIVFIRKLKLAKKLSTWDKFAGSLLPTVYYVNKMCVWYYIIEFYTSQGLVLIEWKGGDNVCLCRFSCRRASRCLSPLLIPPKSPTPSDSSNNSPAPLSPLLGTLQLDLYQRKDMTLFLPKDKQPGSSPHDRNPPLGRIHFRLRYDLDKSDLHVHMIEGEPNIAHYNQFRYRHDDVLGSI